MPLKSVRLVLAVLVLAVLCAPAMAADDAGATSGDDAGAGDSASEYPEVSNDLSIGFLRTSGNTESESLNFDLQTAVDYRLWEHELELKAFKASEDGDDTAERYSGRLQTDYSLSERTYVFGSGRYTRDHFGAYSRRGTLGTGIGRRFIDTGTMTLKGQVGVGYRQSRQQDSHETHESATADARGKYVWKFSDTSEFHQVLSVEAGEDNTVTHSTSKLKSKLTEALSLVLSYEIRNNSKVADDRHHTDTYTAVSVEYGF